MNADQLKQWREHMKFDHEQAAAALGLSFRAYQEKEYGRAPIRKVDALACAAVLAGVLEYDESLLKRRKGKRK